ncbi:hypothetical protein ACH42_07650 [Endozoicomonas sp. (ex Bugula neritina AB1)]|nr:hypothetical protein ACH42_07650 [Endozoicomonas sp. (ex Bugula neritina AB1)]
MQKKLLAAVVTSLVASQAMAVAVVDDGTSKFEIGGHVGARYQIVDSGDAEAVGDSSRINISGESKLNDTVTAFAEIEYGFSTTNNGDTVDDFTARLGYVGVKSDKLGSLTLGKQWSSYYTVAGWTDMFATTGGDAVGVYNNHEINGTGRPDDAIQYNISANGLNVSAQYQVADADSDTAANPDQKDRKSSYGLAVSYDLPMGLSFGATYNEARFDDDFAEAKASALAVKYAQGPIYAAATYAKMENHATISTVDLEKAVGMELYVSYQLNDNFKLETGYNQLESDNNLNTDTELKYIPVGVVYNYGAIQLSGIYQFENTKVDGEDKEDKVILQARYYF